MKLKPICYLGSLLIILSLLFSCTKEPAVVDYNVGHLPMGFDVDTTIVLQAYTIRQDSLNTMNKAYGIIGACSDPVFGNTTAGFFTQIIPANNTIDENPILDSLVISFGISNIIGSSNYNHEIRLYELTTPIKDTTTYYTRIQGQETEKDTISYDYANPIFKGICKVSKDTIIVGGKKVPPQIRINLTEVAPEFVNKILNCKDHINSASAFTKYMNGIYCTAVSTPELNAGADVGNFAQINFLSPEATGIALYYHTNEKDSLVKRFVVDKTSKRWMRYKHYDYAQADPMFKQQVLGKDTLMGKERLYIQSLLGVKVRIALPDLSTLENKGKIIINEAKLVINNIGEDSNIPVPKSLIVRAVNTKGVLVPLADEFEFGGDKYYYNGLYTASKKQYYVRISRFINQKLHNLGDVGMVKYLELFSYNDVLSSEIKPEAERLILCGTDPSFTDNRQRMSLRILYSFSPEVQE